MSLIYYNVKIDTTRYNTNLCLVAVANDTNSRVILAQIANNGTVIDIPDSATVSMTFRTPSGDGYSTAATVSNSVVTIPLPSECLAEVGVVKAEIYILYSETDSDTGDVVNRSLTTRPFAIKVTGRVYDGSDEAVNSETYNELDTALLKVSAALTEVNTITASWYDEGGYEEQIEELINSASFITEFKETWYGDGTSEGLEDKIESMIVEYYGSDGTGETEGIKYEFEQISTDFATIKAEYYGEDLTGETSGLKYEMEEVISEARALLDSDITIDAEDLGLEQDEDGTLYPTYKGTRSSTGVNISLADYQTIEESTLETDAKEIPSAINELVARLDNFDLAQDDDNTLYITQDGVKVGNGVVVNGIDTTLLGITQDDEGVVSITYDGDICEGGSVTLTGGSGGSSSTSGITITRLDSNYETTTTKSYTIAYGNTQIIYFGFTYTEDGEEVDSSGTMSVTVGGKSVIEQTIYTGNNSVDVTDYLSLGSNTVIIKITDDEGNTQSRSWTVYTASVTISSTFDASEFYDSDITYRYSVVGSGTKVVHLILDGTTEYTTDSFTTSSQKYYTIPAQSHGSHSLEVYATMVYNSVEIESAHLYYDVIWVDETSTTPIIAVSYEGGTMTQYNTIQIPILVYDPTSTTTDITLTVTDVTDADNPTVELTTEWTDVDRTVQYWNYTPSTYGSKVLTITCGDVTKTIEVTVEELDIDYEEDSEYVFRLKASELTSNSDIQGWNSNGITATFSDNFDWVNGGLKYDTDDSGNITQYVCIKAGTYMTINYAPFSTTNNPKTKGLAFDITYKATNCTQYDAEFLNCYTEGVGVKMDAQTATISSTGTTMTVPYIENKYIEFGFDIRSYSSTLENKDRYMISWLNGIPGSYELYTAGSDDLFTQDDPSYIVIGSEDCDVNLYLIKVYAKELNFEQRLQNFVMGAPNATEMLERAERNDILVDGTENAYDFFDIDYNKLANVMPDLRVQMIDISRFPWAKGSKDPIDGCTYKQIYKSGESKDQFTAEDVTVMIQGTSSVNYKEAAMNLDFKCSGGFTDEDGNTSDTYAMTDDSIGVNYFNCKVNVASCEQANNMCLADWYNTYQPYVTDYRESNSKARDTMELHMGVLFVRDQNTNSTISSDASYNPYMNMYGTSYDDTRYYMYSICNTGNSKKNSEVFHDPDNPYECCMEVLNNSDAACRMIVPINTDDDNAVTEDYSGDHSFEFRYSSDDADILAEQKEAWERFVNWMAECNPSAATGDALDSSVTYEAYTFKGTGKDCDVLAGTTVSQYAGTYTNDTFEYRVAKMLSECEDYMIMDSVIYHYLFIERFTMIDNVAKNTFWGSEDLVHWHLCKDYDNDTAMGNDNQGQLTLAYGYETDDTIGSGDVFNAKDAVWFVFARALKEARTTMFIDREGKGAWSTTSLTARFDEEQSLIPERVWIQDYWFKYFRLYEWGRDDSTYRPMLAAGKKEYQREQFNTYQEPYMSGMYQGSSALGDLISFRSYNPETWEGVEPGHTITFTAYAKGYYPWKAGNTTVNSKLDRGESITIDLAEDGAAFNNIETMGYNARLLQSISGLPALYIGTVNFSAAYRLTELTIGSSEDGYSNSNLTELGLSSNTLLRELYVQNLPAVTSVLDLSDLIQLRYIDARGSGFKGFAFANGGLLEDAYLEAPSSLTLQNLSALDNLSIEDYSNLETLTFENCPYVDCVSLLNAATNLKRVRLLDVDWELDDASLLETLSGLAGLDESGNVTEQSVITGTVYVGSITSLQYEKYTELWSGLTITYGIYTPSYVISFVDGDGNIIEELTQNVTQGETITEPDYTPTKTETAQYSYAFDYWYSETSGYNNTDGTFNFDTKVYANITVYSSFTSTTKQYTVTYTSINNTVVDTQTVDYGSSAFYSGDEPVYKDLEEDRIYYLFRQWDKIAWNVTEDMTIKAVFDVCQYGYSGTDGTVDSNGYTWYTVPEKGTDIATWVPVQFYAIQKLADAAVGTSTDVNYIEDNYVDDDDDTALALSDRFDIKMGYENDYDNVESEDLVETYLNDENYSEFHFNKAWGEKGLYFNGSNFINTGIDLMSDDDRAWTLVLECTYYDTTSGTLLMSCFDGSVGLACTYSGGAAIQINGVNRLATSRTTARERYVIRHPANSTSPKFFYIYAANPSGNASTNYTASISTGTTTDAPIVLGGRLNSLAATDTLISGSGATGVIHECKIYWADLGADECKKMVTWTTEDTTFEVTNFGGAYYDTTGCVTRLDFMTSSSLLFSKQQNSSNTNYGGYNATALRKWLDQDDDDTDDTTFYERAYNAFPYQWRQMFKQIVIRQAQSNYEDDSTTTLADTSGSVQEGTAYVTIPSYGEVQSVSSGIYYTARSGDPISYYMSSQVYTLYDGDGTEVDQSIASTSSVNYPRIIFTGRTIPEDARYFVGTTTYPMTVDPTASGYSYPTVKEGDVLVPSATFTVTYDDTTYTFTSGRGYMYTTTYKSGSMIPAADGVGYWIEASSYWLRDANVSNTTNFCNVNNNGNVNNNNNASNSNALRLRFSYYQ